MKITDIIDRTCIKFVMVGIVNMIFGSVIMFAIYNLVHCSYGVFSASNYIYGSVLSFFLNKHFTFQNKSKDISVVINICG